MYMVLVGMIFIVLDFMSLIRGFKCQILELDGLSCINWIWEFCEIND